MAKSLIKAAALTHELRKLAAEVYTVTNDGTPITREAALADLIWKQALGWVEEIRDDHGTLQKVPHKPVGWAQQFLWERIEGRAVVAQPNHDSGMRAAEKVRGLARDRLNAMAKARVGGPPPHKPKAVNEPV